MSDSTVKTYDMQLVQGKYPHLEMVEAPEDYGAWMRKSDYAVLQSQLSACQSALEKRGWQPIETAPKERDILVSTKNGVMYVACWDCERDDSDFPWAIADEYYGRVLFTHWQPLPSPPEEAHK